MSIGHGFESKMALARQLNVNAMCNDGTVIAASKTIQSASDVANWSTSGVEVGDLIFVYRADSLADIRTVQSISTSTITVTEVFTANVAGGDASCWAGIDFQNNVPTVLGAGDQIPIISEGITDNIGHVNYVYKNGTAGVADSDQTFRKYSGTVTCQAMYETIERIVCYALGFSPPDDSPGGANTGSSVYLHHFEMADDLAQTEYKHWEREPSGTTGSQPDLSLNRFTLGIWKEVETWEYDCTMVNRMRLSCSPERTVVELDVVSRDVDRPSAGNNSAATTWAFTSSTVGNQNLLFQDLVVRMRMRDEYTISASNDTLIFTESVAGAKTAHVADGSYSGAELAAAIKTAIEVNSSLTYTCSYDEPTQKFTFTPSSGTIKPDVSASDMCLNTTTGASTVGFIEDGSTASSITSPVPAEPNGGALDDNDKVSISTFELVVERNLDMDSQSTISGLYIEEPTANDFYRVTGSFTMPRYKNDDFLSRLNDDDIMIGDLIFTGNSLAASTYLFKIFLPHFKFTSVTAPVTDAGALSVTHAFEAFRPTIAPCGDMGIVSATSNMEEFMWVMTYDGDDGGTYCITEHEGDIYAGNTVADQVYRMNESTQMWGETAEADPADATTVECMCSFAGALYVGLSGGTDAGEIWKTTDQGANWTLAEDIASVTDIHDLKVVNVLGTDYICAATATATAAGLWYSSDGATWTNTTDADITGDTSANCIFQSTDSKIWVGTTLTDHAGTHYSTPTTDAATTFNGFTDMDAGADLTGVPDTVYTICEHRGRIYCGCETGEIGRLEWDTTNWDLVVDIGSEPVYGLESYQGALWAITGTTDAILYWFTETDFDTTNRKYDLGEADGHCIYGAPNGILYVGTGTGSKIFARRPIPPLVIHVNNQLSENPALDREPIV